jgi:hypothetical protein
MSAAKIGKILGVQYLIMGKVTEFSTDSKGGTIIIPRNNFGINIKSNIARVAIDARLVDATSAEITSSVTGKGEKKQTNVGLIANWNLIAFGSDEFKKTNLGFALRDAVKSVADQLGEKVCAGPPPPPIQPPLLSGFVADVFGNKVYLTVGAADGVHPGMAFTVNHVIRVVKNPKTGEVIDHITEPVAEISVAEVKEKSSVCVVVTRLNTHYGIAPNDLVQLKPNPNP